MRRVPRALELAVYSGDQSGFGGGRGCGGGSGACGHRYRSKNRQTYQSCLQPAQDGSSGSTVSELVMTGLRHEPVSVCGGAADSGKGSPKVIRLVIPMESIDARSPRPDPETPGGGDRSIGHHPVGPGQNRHTQIGSHSALVSRSARCSKLIALVAGPWKSSKVICLGFQSLQRRRWI